MLNILTVLAMLGRILLLGYERVAVKQAGEQNDSLASTFLLFGVAGVLMLPMLIIDQFSLMTWLYASLSSLFYSIAFFLYVKSLSTSEVSLVSPFYNFNVLFLLFLSVLFLSEAFTPVKLVGVFLLVLGTSLVERRQNLLESFKAVMTDHGCQMMIAASFLIAVGRIIDARVIRDHSPLAYSIGVYFMIAFYVGIMLMVRGKVGEITRAFSGDKKYFLGAAGANAYSYVFLLVAIQELEVSIAEPLSMLSVFVTLFLSYIILKENAKTRLLGVTNMVLGSILLLVSI